MAEGTQLKEWPDLFRLRGTGWLFNTRMQVIDAVLKTMELHQVPLSDSFELLEMGSLRLGYGSRLAVYVRDVVSIYMDGGRVFVQSSKTCDYIVFREKLAYYLPWSVRNDGDV